VAHAQVQGKYSAIFDIDTLQYVRFQFQVGGVTDQPRVTVNHDLANVLLLAHQQAHLAPVLAGFEFAAEADDLRLLRHSLVDAGQIAAAHAFEQHRRFGE